MSELTYELTNSEHLKLIADHLAQKHPELNGRTGNMHISMNSEKVIIKVTMDDSK